MLDNKNDLMFELWVLKVKVGKYKTITTIILILQLFINSRVYRTFKVMVFSQAITQFVVQNRHFVTLKTRTQIYANRKFQSISRISEQKAKKIT